LLATSDACPVQAFRVRENLYVTQFHPELDVDGVISRVMVYRDAGYFPPEDFDRIVANLRASNPIEPARLMRAFVERYRRERFPTSSKSCGYRPSAHSQND